MKRESFAFAGILIFISSSGAETMTNQILDAEILDQRVTRCGVSIEGDAMKSIRPFIETSDDLKGKIDINVRSRSGSNVNATHQSIGFPGNSVISVGRPSSMRIEMTATAQGREICRLSEEIEFEQPGIRI
jgi:hypothetical protein